MEKNLYDIFAKRWLNDCDSIWIYSDPHFGDLESYIFRQVIDIKERDGKIYYRTSEIVWEDENSLRCSMYFFDEMQIKNINSKAGKNSCLIILGDVGDLERVKELKAKYKILIMGNHDKGASNYKREIESKEYLNGETGAILYREIISDNHLFDEVYEGPLMINDRVILSHESIDNLPKYIFNIHGHDHSNSYKSDNSMNVCAEHINYTPINLNSLLKNGLLKNIESIHRATIDNAIKRNRKKKINKN